jgi:hypothetical protein
MTNWLLNIRKFARDLLLHDEDKQLAVEVATPSLPALKGRLPCNLGDPFGKNWQLHLRHRLEISYMPLVLEANSYHTICHEHLEYYSLTVVENVLRRADLKAFRATFNLINGGSIRVYPTHAAISSSKTRAYAEELRKLRQQEFELECDTDSRSD